MQNIREIITLVEAASGSDITQVKLDYGMGALSPVISRSTMDNHYGKLYKKYVETYNKNHADSFNAAGAELHSIYFSQFKRPGSSIQPRGKIADIIHRHYSDFLTFKKAMKEQANNFHGSGWLYLSKSGQIRTIQNHAHRTDIALLIDLWEHAYQNDHGSKDKYMDAIWRIMDWDKINHRL
jgi:Fe-Mn family superoxide dismutase